MTELSIKIQYEVDNQVSTIHFQMLLKSYRNIMKKKKKRERHLKNPIFI